ncbi:MAG: PAS domain-containing protein [Vicinamibacterales bacterium]
MRPWPPPTRPSTACPRFVVAVPRDAVPVARWLVGGLLIAAAFTMIALLAQLTWQRQQDVEHTADTLQGVLDAATHSANTATDSSGKISVFNRGAELMLQYRSQEVVGIHSPAIVHDAKECEERSPIGGRRAPDGPRGRGLLHVEWARAGGIEDREWTYIRKDGSRLDVHPWSRPCAIATGSRRGTSALRSTSHGARRWRSRRSSRPTSWRSRRSRPRTPTAPRASSSRR